MSKPIILIDDDDDDLDLFQQALINSKCTNEIWIFNDPAKFLNFIRTSNKSFSFILCDINMNGIDGLQLKKILHDDEELRMKCVPFLFWSTSSASPTIRKAYSYNVQGYFVKPDNLHDLEEMIRSIVSYWNYAEHPNSG